MSEEIPTFNNMGEAYEWARAERLARNGWIEQANNQEKLARLYKSAFDNLLESIVKHGKASLKDYCTKHQLFHGQKYPSCRTKPLVEGLKS